MKRSLSSRPSLDRGLVDALRTVLEAAGFTADGIRDHFGVVDGVGLWSGEAASFLRSVTGGDNELAPGGLEEAGQPSALGVLVRLWLLAVPVDPAIADEALAPLSIGALAAAGLVDVGETGARTLVRLVPEGDLIVASDPQTKGKGCVPGVNNAALTLSSLTIRRPVETALDLGTGNGYQALLAARHATTVVGTDINRRALRLARLAAQLNGIANLTWRPGSWFEPVGDQQFDLVVANPPYVISPDTAHLYRDSDLPGDTVCRELVRAIPPHLREGAFATVMCNWIHRPDEHWSQPLRQWVDGCGCDALLLHYGTHEPLTYAARWNQPLRDTDLRAFRRALDRWLRYYQAMGIEAIGFGSVVLRRRSSASNWVRALDAGEGPSGPAGEHLLRIVHAQDWLDSRAVDADLLGARVVLVDGHRLDQTLTFESGAYEALPATLRLLAGAGAVGSVDPRVLKVFFACDGTRRLGDLVDEAADDLDTDRDELAELTTATVRRLFADGLLILTGAQE